MVQQRRQPKVYNIIQTIIMEYRLKTLAQWINRFNAKGKLADRDDTKISQWVDGLMDDELIELLGMLTPVGMVNYKKYFKI